MTREEAIKMIKAKLECMTRDVSGRDSDCINRRCDECPLNYEKGNMGEQKEWLRMAIEALKQQPNEDCIRRSDVSLTNLEILMCNGDYKEALKMLLDKIEKAPSVNLQPKVGHWIEPQQDDGMSDPIYYQVRCSECNFDLDPQTWSQELHQYGADKYCPRCGCRMQEVKK